jgi:CrcB protein
MTALIALAIMIAGGFGASVRYITALVIRSPWGVLSVNVLGSALGGMVLGLSSGLSDATELILLAGFAGGLTTFSTFSVETIDLLQRGRWRSAALSVATNVTFGLAAAVFGYCLFT